MMPAKRRTPRAIIIGGSISGLFSAAFLRNTDNTLGIQFWVAQVLADKFGISREEMDAYALESHRRAAENTDNGHFARETIPVPIKDAGGHETGEMLTADELEEGQPWVNARRDDRRGNLFAAFEDDAGGASTLHQDLRDRRLDPDLGACLAQESAGMPSAERVATDVLPSLEVESMSLVQ